MDLFLQFGNDLFRPGCRQLLGLHVETNELGFGGAELIRKLVFRIAANHDRTVNVRAIAEHVAGDVVKRLGLTGLGECKEDCPVALIVVEGGNDVLGSGDLVRVSHGRLDFFLNGNDGNGNGDDFNDFNDFNDFLDLDFGNRNGNSDIKLLSHGILMLDTGFMTRTVALVSSAIAGPCAAAKGALSDSTIRKLTRLTRFANLLR